MVMPDHGEQRKACGMNFLRINTENNSLLAMFLPCFHVPSFGSVTLPSGPQMSWLTDWLPETEVQQIIYKRCWSTTYNTIHEIVPWKVFSFFSAKGLRNFYLITDVQARTCDYCFHVKREVSWISSLLNYRARRVEMEGKGQLNWQLAELDMFEKMKMSGFGQRAIS